MVRRDEEFTRSILLSKRFSRRQLGYLGLGTLGGILVSPLLAACGGDDDDDDDEPADEGATDDEPTATVDSAAGAPTATEGAAEDEPTVTEGEAEPTSTEGGTAAGDAPAPGGTFRIAKVRIDPENADPAAANESVSNDIVLAIYESLVAYAQGSIELEPRLATSWEISDDGLTYTFELREDVTFHDGSLFDAEAVKFTVDRMHELGKGAAYVLVGVYQEVEVVDPQTANIILSDPSAPFLSGLPKVFMLSPSFVEPHISDDDPFAEEWVQQNFMGTGPFKFKSWELEQEFVLEKNTDYWDQPNRPLVDEVVFQAVPEVSAQRLMVERGDVDVIFAQPDDIASLEANPDVQVATPEAIIQLYIQVSQVVPPLDDPLVRKAIAHAFDYETFIEGVMNGLAVRSHGPLPQNIPYHDPNLEIPDYDLDRARELLAEAGYPDGGFELEYVPVQGDQPETGAGLILQSGLAELGINLSIVELPWPEMVARMQNPDNLMHLYGYYRFPPYADPDAFFVGMWHTSNQLKGYNGTMYGSEETDALIEAGRSTIDEQERAEIYRELQQRVVDDVAALWLANPLSLAALSGRTRNYLYTPPWHQTINTDTVWIAQS